MELELYRFYSPKGTNGVLLMNKKIFCLTIEFSKAYFSEASKKMLTGTVQYSQAATSFLLNRVYEYNEAAPNEFYKFVQGSLCFFIRVLYKNFPAHFDYSLTRYTMRWCLPW